MAIIGNFPGGSKPAIGNATVNDVLVGKTFSSQNGNNLTGALAGTRGALPPDTMAEWVLRTSALSSITWVSVCYGNGLFVATATTGTGNCVMTSPDGINWTIRSSAADNKWNSVTYGNGLFVAVSSNGTGNRVMTSGQLVEILE